VILPSGAAGSSSVPVAGAARRGPPRALLLGGAVLVAGLASIPLWLPSSKPTAPRGPGVARADVPPVGPAKPTPGTPTPAMTDPAMTDPAMTDPAMTDPAMGEPAMGPATPGMDSTWATDMPAMEEPPAPAMGPDRPGPATPPTPPTPLPPPEPPVVAHRAVLLEHLLSDDGLTVDDVAASRTAMAKSASSAKADLVAARKALAAALAAQTRADWNALDAALPEAVVRPAAAKLGSSAADVRRGLREIYQDAAIAKARVVEVVAVGADWAVASVAGVDSDDVEIEAAALLVFEGGVWKVVVAW